MSVRASGCAAATYDSESAASCNCRSGMEIISLISSLTDELLTDNEKIRDIERIFK